MVTLNQILFFLFRRVRGGLSTARFARGRDRCGPPASPMLTAWKVRHKIRTLFAHSGCKKQMPIRPNFRMKCTWSLRWYVIYAWLKNAYTYSTLECIDRMGVSLHGRRTGSKQREDHYIIIFGSRLKSNSPLYPCPIHCKRNRLPNMTWIIQPKLYN